MSSIAGSTVNAGLGQVSSTDAGKLTKLKMDASEKNMMWRQDGCGAILLKD
jgi:hypothetical protein